MDLVKEKGYKTQTMFLVADAKGKEVEVVEAADADNNTKIMNLKIIIIRRRKGNQGRCLKKYKKSL